VKDNKIKKQVEVKAEAKRNRMTGSRNLRGYWEL
jgi:hypothetical protein